MLGLCTLLTGRFVSRPGNIYCKCRIELTDSCIIHHNWYILGLWSSIERGPNKTFKKKCFSYTNNYSTWIILIQLNNTERTVYTYEKVPNVKKWSKIFPVLISFWDAMVKWLRFRLSNERLDVRGPPWSVLVAWWRGIISQPRSHVALKQGNSRAFQKRSD